MKTCVVLLTATQQSKRKTQLRFLANAFGAGYMDDSDICRSTMLRERIVAAEGLHSGSDRSCLRIQLSNANAQQCYITPRYLFCSIKIVAVKSKG